MALIENIQREDLNVIEEAQALERLQDEFELTHQQVADAIGKSRTTVTNLLRLNLLDAPVKRLVEQKKLEMGHARALLTLEQESQAEAAQVVADKKMTVRQTEQYVKKLQEPKEEKKEPVDQEAVALSERLSEKIGSSVVIKRSANGRAKMTISVDEPHKLEQLIALLEG